MGLFLGSLFCSIHLCVCFYASTMLFWLQWLYSSLISGSVIPPTLFFFLGIAVAMWGLLWFHINFSNICSSSMKYVIRILIGVALNLLITLHKMDILMILVLPVYEHGVCFHLFVSSSIFFLQCLIIFQVQIFYILG